MNSKCENSKAIVSYFGCDNFQKIKPVEMKTKNQKSKILKSEERLQRRREREKNTYNTKTHGI